MMRYAILLAMLMCLPVRGEAWQVVGGGAAGGAASAFYDSFTESSNVLLANHTPESGGTWIADTATGAASYGTVYSATGDVKLETATASIWYNTATPASDNYTVTSTFNLASMGSYLSAVGPCLRMDGKGSGYCARYEGNTSGRLYLQRLSPSGGWTGTSLGYAVPSEVFSPSQYTISIGVSGNNLTATLKNSSGATIATRTATDSNITSAGHPGFIIGNTSLNGLTEIEIE